MALGPHQAVYANETTGLCWHEVTGGTWLTLYLSELWRGEGWVTNVGHVGMIPVKARTPRLR